MTRLALGAMQKRGGIETDEKWGERRGQGLAGLGELGEIVKKGRAGRAERVARALKFQEVEMECVSTVHSQYDIPRYSLGWTWPKKWYKRTAVKARGKWTPSFHGSYPDVAVVCRVLCSVYEWTLRKHDQSPRVGHTTAFDHVYRDQDNGSYTSGFSQPRATALGAARAVAVSFWHPSQAMVEKKKKSNTKIHYQRKLLTSTVMEDEEGNSMLKSDKYLSHEFLKTAVFGEHNWDELQRRDDGVWQEAGKELMGLPKKVWSARLKHDDGSRRTVELPRVEGFGEEQLREAMFDFLRRLPWGRKYTNERGIPVLPVEFQ